MPTPIRENSKADSASKAAPCSGLTERVLMRSGPQQRVEFLEQLAAAEHHLPAMAAQLAPQARRTNTCEQQRTNLRRIVGLLHVAHVALHLNALAEGADGVLIQAGAVGYHVFMGRAEMLDLLLYLIKAAAHDLQHVTTLIQLALQGQQRQGITQRITLQAGWIALQGADQRTVAVAQVEVIAAVDVQGVFRVAHQQAVDHAGYGRLADPAGACQFVNQYRRFEYCTEGDQLLADWIHAVCSRAVQGSAVSITPPPRQISPS